MKGTERRKEILAWLEDEKNLSLPQIVERFGISKMTAHRDLDALERRQVLKRIHGGVVKLDKPAAESGPQSRAEQGRCMVCYRPASQHLLYSLTLSNGDQRVACCPHCGVSAHLMLGEQVAMALTADYLTGRPHPAQRSFFVLGSAAIPCCRPSMLTFEDVAMARRFQAGFGGVLGSLEEAIRFLQEEMSLHREGGDCPHCAAVARSLDES
jgi:DeoR family transcriptional regulator, copper-sensing transcriptional repressor